VKWVVVKEVISLKSPFTHTQKVDNCLHNVLSENLETDCDAGGHIKKVRQFIRGGPLSRPTSGLQILAGYPFCPGRRMRLM